MNNMHSFLWVTTRLCMVQAFVTTPRPSSLWSTKTTATTATTPLGLWTTHATGVIQTRRTPSYHCTFMTSSKIDVEEEEGTELWRMGRLSKTVATPSQVESLVVYLQTVFGSSDTDALKKLTTPVQVQTTPQGLRLLFVPNEPSYRDNTNDNNNKKDNDDDWRANANAKPKQENNKKKKKKQGGVEFQVEAASPQLTVIVRRCNMDDDTMIREMSEETILSQLQSSIQVWKKEQKNSSS
eukprot:scaffold3281_cov55-Attheya_sp.AAC.5